MGYNYQDNRAQSGEDGLQTVIPLRREAPGFKNAHETVPGDGVESLGEGKLEYDGWHLPLVTALHQFSSIGEIFRDGTPSDEASLIDINEVRDLQLKPRSQEF